jgi:signal transduction histidine kinase
MEKDILEKQVLTRGYSDDYEKEYIRKDGSVFPINIRTLLVKNELENPKGYWALIRDISERKDAEEKIKESEKKYREAYNRSNLYKDLFTHDINNILQIILSSIELFSLRLENQDTHQKFDDVLNLVKEQITRGSKLVKNVQKLSEIEDTKKPIISIDLFESLNKSIEFVKNSFHYKNLDVKINTSLSKGFVRGNDLLPNIFENILLNAVRHNLNEVIEILIKISKVKKDQTDCIKFEFIDNGIGIPDLLKKEIFSRKPREIEKEKMTSGMGLGLILVKSILNAINGEIAVEDRIKGDYAKGSNFIIIIPEAK